MMCVLDPSQPVLYLDAGWALWLQIAEDGSYKLLVFDRPGPDVPRDDGHGALLIQARGGANGRTINLRALRQWLATPKAGRLIREIINPQNPGLRRSEAIVYLGEYIYPAMARPLAPPQQ